MTNLRARLAEVLADIKPWSCGITIADLLTDPALARALEDAERWNTIVESGAFAPPAFVNSSCPLGLRMGGTKATKAELDKAVDDYRTAIDAARKK